jgi:tetratricopeptide (TPR) repeat protein
MISKKFSVPALMVMVLATAFTGSPVRSVDRPKIESVLPASGVTTPGIRTTVRGSGFSPSTIVFFDGLEARETKLVSPTELEVLTPYLRPGAHRLQVLSDGVSLRTSVEFTALPSDVDAQIDRANELATQGRIDEAIEALDVIAKNNSDYQVRAAAYYIEGQIYFNEGDFGRWRGASDLIYLDAASSGSAVQTFWAYRLAFAESHYLVENDQNPKQGFDLWLADKLVEFDITQSAEPRFYRGLLNIRSGKLAAAKADSEFVSKAWPDRPSAAALSAYAAALNGDTRQLRALTSGSPPTDATALTLIGEASFATGDLTNANKYWLLAGNASPKSATIGCLAAKKHLKVGPANSTKSLLAECVAMAPGSREADDARTVLSKLKELQ